MHHQDMFFQSGNHLPRKEEEEEKKSALGERSSGEEAVFSHEFLSHSLARVTLDFHDVSRRRNRGRERQSERLTRLHFHSRSHAKREIEDQEVCLIPYSLLFIPVVHRL